MVSCLTKAKSRVVSFGQNTHSTVAFTGLQGCIQGSKFYKRMKHIQHVRHIQRVQYVYNQTFTNFSRCTKQIGKATPPFPTLTFGLDHKMIEVVSFDPVQYNFPSSVPHVYSLPLLRSIQPSTQPSNSNSNDGDGRAKCTVFNHQRT